MFLFCTWLLLLCVVHTRIKTWFVYLFLHFHTQIVNYNAWERMQFSAAQDSRPPSLLVLLSWYFVTMLISSWLTRLYIFILRQKCIRHKWWVGALMLSINLPYAFNKVSRQLTSGLDVKLEFSPLLLLSLLCLIWTALRMLVRQMCRQLTCG